LLLPAAVLSACNNSTGSPADPTVPVSATGVTGSGNDLYYQYDIKGGSRLMKMDGAMKLYFAASGKVRMEMLTGINANIQGKPVHERPAIVVIGNSNNPTETISLDDSAKTFTKNHIDTAELGNTGMKTQSTVIKAGEDQILGFHCVHAKIITARSIGTMYKMTDTSDLWKSNDVPMQPALRRWIDLSQAKTNTYLYSPEINAQLKQMGCDGMFVKMVTHTKQSLMTMALTKVEKKDFAPGLFEVPAGYKEVRDN
jgi:hypothetical protein